MTTFFCAACTAPLLPALIAIEPMWNSAPEETKTTVRRIGRCLCGAVTAVDQHAPAPAIPHVVQCEDGSMTSAARMADAVEFARADIARNVSLQFAAAAQAGLDVRHIRLWVDVGHGLLPPLVTLAIIRWTWALYGDNSNDAEMGIEECAELLEVSSRHAAQLVEAGAIPSVRLGTGRHLLKRADVLSWRARFGGQAK